MSAVKMLAYSTPRIVNATRKRREAQQPEHAQEPQEAQALQRRRHERRGEEGHDETDRVVAQIPAPVVHDGQHRDKLDHEREPRRPIQERRYRLAGRADVRLFQEKVGDDQQGGDEHWHL
jgi:hypothetical protein